MLICKAILKYGLHNFSLEIIEYCERDRVRVRELHYLDNFPHEYNILKTADPLLNYHHSEAARQKMSESWQDPARRKVGLVNLAKARAAGAAARSQAIRVIEISKNIISNYPSISQAAEALSVTRQALSKRFKTTNSFVLKGRYKIEKKK
jgi:hypothetical protein